VIPCSGVRVRFFLKASFSSFLRPHALDLSFPSFPTFFFFSRESAHLRASRPLFFRLRTNEFVPNAIPSATFQPFFFPETLAFFPSAEKLDSACRLRAPSPLAWADGRALPGSLVRSSSTIFFLLAASTLPSFIFPYRIWSRKVKWSSAAQRLPDITPNVLPFCNFSPPNMRARGPIAVRIRWFPRGASFWRRGPSYLRHFRCPCLL